MSAEGGWRRSSCALQLLFAIMLLGCAGPQVWIAPEPDGYGEHGVREDDVAESIAVASGSATDSSLQPTGDTSLSRSSAQITRPEPSQDHSASTPGLASDEASGPLTLAEVLENVDRSFPLLLAAQQKILQAEAKYQQTLGGIDTKLKGSIDWQPLGFFKNTVADLSLAQPTLYRGLEVFGGWSVGDGDFNPTFDGKRLTNENGEFRGGFTLPLLRNSAIDELRSRLATTSIDIDLAELEVKLSRLKYRWEAAAAYWTWASAVLRLQVVDDLLALARARTEQIEERIAAGELAPIERADNERVVREREALRVDAYRDLQRSEYLLSLYYRDASGKPLIPGEARRPNAIPRPVNSAIDNDSKLLSEALARRPELLALRQRLEQEQVQRSFYENQTLPGLGLSVLASQDLDGRRPSVTKGEFELVVGVALDFPIQNRKALGSVAETEARIEQIRRELSYLEERVEFEINDARAVLRAELERSQLLQQAAALSEQLAEAERLEFELGDSNVFLVNQREQKAAEQRAKAISALAKSWIAEAKFQLSRGLSPSSIEIAPPR